MLYICHSNMKKPGPKLMLVVISYSLVQNVSFIHLTYVFRAINSAWVIVIQTTL